MQSIHCPKTRAIALLLALTMVLAACGDPEPEGAEEATPTAESSQDSTAEPEPTAPPEATATTQVAPTVAPEEGTGPEENVEPEEPFLTGPPPVEDGQTEGESASQSGTEPASSSDDVQAWVDVVVADLIVVQKADASAWPGYAAANYPVALTHRNEADDLVALVVLGNDDPSSLGTATPLDSIPDAYLVTDPTVAIAVPANALFDLFVPVGSTSSFVVEADVNHPLLPVGQPGFAGLLLHEPFHRYQQAWNGSLGDPSVVYDLSAQNLELALLEDAALVAAVDAVNPDAKRIAFSHFVALRSQRLASFPSVALDNSQEWIEGTAFWLEYRSLGETPAPYLAPWFGHSLGDLASIENTMGVEGYFGSQRFFYTGASIIEVLDQLGAPNLVQKFEQGLYPAELALEQIPMSLGAAGTLIDDAREAYDADGALAAQAAAWGA